MRQPAVYKKKKKKTNFDVEGFKEGFYAVLALFSFLLI